MAALMWMLCLLLWGEAVMAQDFECPDAATPPCAAYLYANPAHCHQYYQCTETCLWYLFNCSNVELHFNEDLQACVTPDLYPCEDEPLSEPAVFFVAKNQNQNLRQDPVSFDVELIDRGSDFDMGNARFTAPTSGIYFFSLNMGIIDDRSTSFVLSTGLDYIEEVAVTRDSRQHNGADMTNRDVIKGMSPDDTISILSQGSLYSDDGLQTSFAGFSLHDTMRFQDAFSVSRTSAFDELGTISFNGEILNEGRHFDLNSGTFTVPTNGIYFFSFSVGIDSSSNDDVTVQLQVDGQNRAEIWRNHADYSNFDTLSRALMLTLTEGQVLTLELLTGAIDSTPLHEACWNGFFYNPSSPDPANPMSPVAWSLHATTSTSAESSDVILTFDDIGVNEGGAFNSTTSTVDITESGYYYMHINAGAEAYTPVEMRVVRNGGVEIVLLRASTTHSSVDTLGRSAILFLDEGDVIQIELAANTAVYSSADRLTSFTGFLILNR